MAERSNTITDRKACAQQLAHWLTAARQLRQAAATDPVRTARRRRLREFQAARLAATHADLLDAPRYRQAAQFFLTDLYSPKDLRARDAEIERVLPIMTSMLPVSGLRALLLAAEVDALSEQLDGAMTDVLGAKLDAPLTAADYADAYRHAGNVDGRRRQIDLIQASGQTLDDLAHKPGLFTLLKMMRRPAQAAGLGELQGFLERGFSAFRGMQSADDFVRAIVERERALARALLGGAQTLA